MAIVTIDGIPVYQALVDDAQCGMMRISLVEDPAVQSNFMAFASNMKQIMYSVQDEDRHLVLGCVMRCDFPIYRRDSMGEYYIIYKAETIREMAEKYLAENRQNLVSLMHEKGTDQDGVQMVQYFIKGKGLSPAGFEDIADGSLFAEFHVTNEDVWQDIKQGTYKGFSLEGIFDLVPEQDKDDMEAIVSSLDGKFETIYNLNKQQKMKLKGLMARLAQTLVELGNVTTDKGILSWDGDADLKAGDKVYVEDSEGNRTPAADGDYMTEDGKTIIVVDGAVSEIADAKAEVAPEAPAVEEQPQVAEEQPTDKPEEIGDPRGEIQTDKGLLQWVGEESLKEGLDVLLNNEPAPDGEYVTDEGVTIVVKDGKVESIAKPEQAEETPAEEPQHPLSKFFSRISEEFAQTYGDKVAKIYSIIKQMGYNPEGYILEAGDSFAIYCTYDPEDGEIYYRFKIKKWDNESGDPILESGVKVIPAFVTPEERDLSEQNMAAMAKQVEDLTAKVVELSQLPAGQPAHEEHEKTLPMTGNKGIDRLSKLMASR